MKASPDSLQTFLILFIMSGYCLEVKKNRINQKSNLLVIDCVYISVSSEQMEAAKYMLNDSTFDLSEIRQCRDCYRHSNEQDDPLWFAKPCLPRHELVFAKQKGYTYWPAKVINICNLFILLIKKKTIYNRSISWIYF